ncbi:hypothetical protein [Dulcicalothrix desertica]|uniref:hypothetical protein n=1 Tax=Dulcicalothrix desertica TaxID=32056 RepID=UPI001315AAC9|nr:hypothetical protein [Dulcicalothrix desertica]
MHKLILPAFTNRQQYPKACVFTVPIILHVSIQLQTELSAAPQVCVKQYFNVL